MNKECQHKNIIITYKSRFKIPNGYTEEIEKENFDLGEYFIEETCGSMFCEDCGETLEEE